MTRVGSTASNSGNAGTGNSNSQSGGSNPVSVTKPVDNSGGSNPFKGLEPSSGSSAPNGVPTVNSSSIPSPVTQVPLTGGEPSITGVNDTPPTVPGGADTPGKGVTSVNTKAMQTFAANINELVNPLTDSMNAVQSVFVRAGAFPTALTLASKINDPQSGLQQSLYQSLNQIVQAIGDTSEGVSQMAMSYESGEAANKITADTYNTFVTQAGAMISQLVPSGSAAAPSAGAASSAGSSSAGSSSAGSTGGSSTGGSAGGAGGGAS